MAREKRAADAPPAQATATDDADAAADDGAKKAFIKLTMTRLQRKQLKLQALKENLLLSEYILGLARQAGVNV